MRESPSGPANPNAVVFLNGITIAGNGSSQDQHVVIAGARVGDTVTCTFDSGAIGPILVGNIRISSAGNVYVSLFNYAANPFTINNVHMYVEVFPRG